MCKLAKTSNTLLTFQPSRDHKTFLKKFRQTSPQIQDYLFPLWQHSSSFYTAQEVPALNEPPVCLQSHFKIAAMFCDQPKADKHHSKESPWPPFPTHQNPTHRWKTFSLPYHHISYFTWEKLPPAMVLLGSPLNSCSASASYIILVIFRNKCWSECDQLQENETHMFPNRFSNTVARVNTEKYVWRFVINSRPRDFWSLDCINFFLSVPLILNPIK